MGQFTGEYYTGKIVNKFSKPKDIKVGKYYNYYNSTGKDFVLKDGDKIKITRILTNDFVEITSQGVSNIKINVSDIKILVRQPEKKKIPDAYLDSVKKEARIIFATYSMITEGIDIPRLDIGIDATPRATCEQLVGRIWRPLPGKDKPIWYTIKDKADHLFLGYHNARVREYLACNCNLLYYLYDNQEKKFIRLGGKFSS